MNKLFIVILKQAGEGCDYTIACGVKVIVIMATNMEEAKSRFFLMLQEDFDPKGVNWTDDCGQYCGDKKLDSASICELTGYPKEIPVNKIYENILRDKERIDNMVKEKEERAELQRLLNKYGSNGIY